MKITLEITDTEYAILKTHLVSPEQWAADMLKNKIKNCTDRTYEAITGRIARISKHADKVAELGKVALEERTANDQKPVTVKKDKK